MEPRLRSKVDLLHLKDAEARYAAFQELLALALIETETDIKYRKKYAAVWKGI